ncbi:hypothetical protein MTO96_038816 [Rhipicephalus appendiculatus]
MRAATFRIKHSSDSRVAPSNPTTGTIDASSIECSTAVTAMERDVQSRLRSSHRWTHSACRIKNEILSDTAVSSGVGCLEIYSSI